MNLKRHIQAARVIAFLLISSLTLVNVQAQETYWKKPDSLFKFVQPSASLQMWGIYSMNEKTQLTAGGPLEKVDDRINFLARRARIGFKGKPYPRISYVMMVQYDNLGKDRFSAARGSVNTGTLGILDAYLTVRLTKNDMASVTTGFFQPQFSRECITGDLVVNSLDKSVSQTYIRQHITGKGYGRATGVNVGGMKQRGTFTFAYNAGLFNNNTTSADQKNLPETTGISWSPLTVERVMITFGDPEMKTYAINYDVNNYFNKRNGITLSGFSTQQGKTDIFSSNSSNGFDVLFNYGRLNLDGEWTWMQRRKNGESFKAQTGHIRAGYNLILANKYFIEPCVMIVSFRGDDGYVASGKDKQYDFGVNWYLNKKNNKLSLHYLIQDGEGSNGYTDGVTFQKGNFVALAYVVIF